MKQVLLLFFISTGLFSGCNQSNRIEDEEKLHALMSDFFDCVQKKDVKRLKTLTTDDFLGYVRGRILNYDSLAKLIPRFPSKTAHNLEYVGIDIDNNVAHLIYINHFTVFSDSTQTKSDFLESFAFRKGSDGWKIRFAHSSERK